jgi:hypothetical protein
MDTQDAPEPGSEEGYQRFLNVFGSSQAEYTDAELRQFYRDMLVLAELLISLHLEKNTRFESP